MTKITEWKSGYLWFKCDLDDGTSSLQEKRRYGADLDVHFEMAYNDGVVGSSSNGS